MNLNRELLNPNFSHIYVEKDILDHPVTKKVLSYFSHASVIVIHDYRDVFNRRRQSEPLQKLSQNLILARKKKDFLYHGSPVCQSFDNRYFYYSSAIMNCIYDCEYCFLKGMYPSANIVVFVNLEDFFHDTETLLQEHPVYMCVSYDTDMLALEPILNYANRWSDFTLSHENLSIEIRTKGTHSSQWKHIPVNERVILAFTLSPYYVAEHYEHGTPSLQQRCAMVREAMQKGYPVRLCFDPILIYPHWQQDYENMLAYVKESIDLSKVKDISIGSFRISKNYLAAMRKQYPNSAVLQFPYVCDKGFYHLPNDLQNKAERLVTDQLLQLVKADQLYRWEDTNE